MSALAEQHQHWIEARARLWGALPPPRPVAPRPVSSFYRLKRPTEVEAVPLMFPVMSATAEAHYPFPLANAFPVKPAWRTILEEVAERHNCGVLEILSRRRSRHLVDARHEAMWRMKTETSMSLPEIGRRCGDRDHTTVIWGIRRYELALEGKVLRRTSTVSPAINIGPRTTTRKSL